MIYKLKNVISSTTAAMMLLFFSVPSWGLPEHGKDSSNLGWRARRAEALALAKKHDYPQSERIIQEMVKQAGSSKNSEARLIMSLEDLASVYTSERKFGEARDIYKKILVIDERKYGRTSPMLIKPLNDVIKVTCVNGKCYDTIPELKRLLLIRRKAYGHDSREIPVMLLLLGEANEKEGKYAEAITYFSEAVNTQKKISGNNSSMAIALAQNVERATKEQHVQAVRMQKPHSAITSATAGAGKVSSTTIKPSGR